MRYGCGQFGTNPVTEQQRLGEHIIIMANLWHIDGNSWVRRSLLSDGVAVSALRERPNSTLPARSQEGAPVWLRQYARADAPPIWVLLSGVTPHVWVNGQALSCGLRVLRDRDEILIPGLTRCYFSTEDPARVEPFPAGEGPVFCARCRQPIQPATPAVRCPACGHWCEQSEAKPCWTYGPTCPLCEQPTAFDTGLRWTPEEL